jgi:DNA adenine methylase
MRIIRPPVKYHGGKYYLCKWIIDYLPEHAVYVEPFGGAASVLLNKPRAQFEVYNDLEYSIYCLLTQLRDQPDEFLRRVREIKYTKDEYLKMREIYRDSGRFHALPMLDQAVITYSVRRMSRGGLCGTFCWSSRIYGEGVPGEEHGWLTMLDELPAVCERLKGITVENKDWREVVYLYDSPDTVFYLDPPYPEFTRVFKNAYLIEMSAKDHEEMASVLKQVKGKVLLSSYPSKFYENLYSGWRSITRSIPNHSSHEKVKERKTEVLWINF